MKTDSKPFLYPSVTSMPNVDKTNAGVENKLNIKTNNSEPSEFDQIFKTQFKDSKLEKPLDLNQVKAPLKLSAHANQRLSERSIKIDAETWAKVNNAVDKAEAKGIEDTLVLTSEAALIVNVKNRTVVTAMDKGSLNGNVFTNIDGAVIV